MNNKRPKFIAAFDLKNRTGTAVLVGTLSLALTCAAETVELKSGQRIDGTVKAITGEEVLLEVAGQPLKFPLANVSAIYFAAPPKSTVANPLNDALRVLKGLQSAVYGGVTYDDFAPRVTDAKIQIDQMLSDAPDSPAKKSLAEALGFYVYASSAWNAHITHGRDVAQCKALERNPLFYKCEVLKRTTLTAMILWGVEPLFECASERVATAERLIDNAIKRGEEWGNESPNPTPSEFAKLAMKLRQQEMAQIPPLTEPTTPNGAIQRYPWKMNIVTTVFWVGEESGNGKMSHQRESAWDANWMANYGGYDNPDPERTPRLHSCRVYSKTKSVLLCVTVQRRDEGPVQARSTARDTVVQAVLHRAGPVGLPPSLDRHSQRESSGQNSTLHTARA